MFKYLKFYSLLTVLSFSLFFMVGVARADCSQSNTLNVVVSDPSGPFVGNAQVWVYSQVTDINGHPKPGSQLAHASTDSTLGEAKLVWRDNLASSTYAVKIQPPNTNSVDSFWYYNQALSCGETATVGATLSGITFSLHDSSGNIMTNTGFKVYSQVYDSAGQVQKQFNQLMASPNSGSSGQVRVYLPQGSVRSLDGTKSDVYALSLARNNQNFAYYNIAVNDGRITTLNYYIPSLNVRLKDANGGLYPRGTRVDVFWQTVDAKNLRQVGSQAGNFILSTDGSGHLDLVPGIYVLGIKGSNGIYQYFWDVQVTDGQANTYTLTSTANQSNSTVTTSCPNNLQFTLIAKDFSGNLIPGLHYALYEQETDANGVPVPSQNSVRSGQLNDFGQTIITFRPDPIKSYALKFWDHNQNKGEFWFFNALRFTCGTNLTLTERVPALHIVLRDSQGQLQRNHNFSLYAQRFDADHQPYFQNSDLIANLETDGGGQTTVYVAPYNSYVPDQSGIYALSVPDSNGHRSAFYNIQISSHQDDTFDASLSGVSGQLSDSQGNLLAHHNINLYNQLTDSTRLALGTKLLGLQTNASGQFQFEYPAGTYALVTSDDFNRPNIFWNIPVKAGSPYLNLKTSRAGFSLTDSQGLGLPSSPNIDIYALNYGSGNTYTLGNKIGSVTLQSGQVAYKNLAAGVYLAQYLAQGNQKFGQPFYLKNGEDYLVKIRTSNRYLIKGPTFYLPANASAIDPLSATVANNSTASATSRNSSQGSSASSSSSSSRTALASRLKGRILLQVQDKGQAWYVNPASGQRYSLGRPADAFNLMRTLALGISNANFDSVQSQPTAWSRLYGRILLKVQDAGKAYYFDPVGHQLYYLGRPADAFKVMRKLGLGITNSNLSSIKVAR